jgi:hypothetical protein
VNKYVAFGLTAEAVAGKHMIVVSHNSRAARDAMTEFLTLAKQVGAEVRQASGREGIKYIGGGHIRFVGTRTDGRGINADIVFIDWDAGTDNADLLHEAQALIATSISINGQIVRA